MSTQIYISRNFVEFGPFHEDEILSFFARGIFMDSDHVRAHGADVWLSLAEWTSDRPVSADVPEEKPEPKAKKTAAKKAPAKNAAAKAKKKAKDSE